MALRQLADIFLSLAFAIFLLFGVSSIAGLLGHVGVIAATHGPTHSQAASDQLASGLITLLAAGCAALAALCRGDSARGWGLRVPNRGPRRSLTEYVAVAGSAYFGVLGTGELIVALAYQLGGNHLAYARPDLPLSVALLTSITAGISEEVVVLAGVVRGFAWIGIRSPASAALRISYHLDYGLGALPMAGWAVATVLLYLRTRRVLPFIAAHTYMAVVAATSWQRFIESDRVPADGQQVDTTWQYVNVKGGPDRRYSNNRELPVMLYQRLLLTSSNGLRWEIDCSRGDAVGRLAGILRAAPNQVLGTAADS